MKIIRWSEAYLGIDIYPMLEQDEPLTFTSDKSDYVINIRTHSMDIDTQEWAELVLPQIHISATVGTPLDVCKVKKIHEAIGKAIEIAETEIHWSDGRITTNEEA